MTSSIESRSNTQIQLDLPGFNAAKAALELLTDASEKDRGAVYTRKEVVEFILDLVGYTSNKPLYKFKILEPSFGSGDFLFPIIERLFASLKNDFSNEKLKLLTGAVRGVELHHKTFFETKNKVELFLKSTSLSSSDRKSLIETWLINGDFLLEEIESDFTHVVGNPPYVRQELIPEVLISEYRRRYKTIYDRADLYVPFIERALSLLAQHGSLGFICADRWMKNKYGGPLRKLVADNYHFAFYIDMINTPAFHSDVIAYPAIIVISNDPPGETKIARQPEIQDDYLRSLAKTLTSEQNPKSGIDIIELGGVGNRPWIFESKELLSLVKKIEDEFPLIEETGCKIGIGVATGSDEIYVQPYNKLDVEKSRKLPLVTTKDIVDGTIKYKGLGVLNPFEEDGSIALLNK